MIYSVFCPTDDVALPWRGQLLGYSWARARQPGELVQLVASGRQTAAPCHPLARVLETQRWSPHPYTGDPYPAYQRAAALLEWLFVERIEGTVLVLETSSVFRAPVPDEVRSGQARGTAWAELPRGDGPFGLGPGFEFLSGVCVDRALALSPVKLPVLIHSTDLRKLVARWLELTSIIRAETGGAADGPFADAANLAYVIAAAEARIPHSTAELGLLDCGRPIPSTDGALAWDAATYQSWSSVHPESVPPGPDREFLSLLAELVERRGREPDEVPLRPLRGKGVREGKILGSLFLEIPGRAETVSLNPSGAAIWEVCDGTRTLAEINRELETRYDMPSGSLQADVEVVIRRLEGIGALRLTP